MPKDYYALLGLMPQASPDEVREGFMRQAELYHPDRPDGGNPARMVDLCEAVEVLADPGKRALYDRHRANPNDDATRRAWESAEAAASDRAHSFSAGKGDLQQFLNGLGADVRKTRGGRILTGIVGGLLIGALAAFLVGYFMGLNTLYCAAIGGAVGAAGGAFGSASNE